jgi:hypothetical protein
MLVGAAMLIGAAILVGAAMLLPVRGLSRRRVLLPPEPRPR